MPCHIRTCTSINESCPCRCRCGAPQLYNVKEKIIEVTGEDNTLRASLAAAQEGHAAAQALAAHLERQLGDAQTGGSRMFKQVRAGGGGWPFRGRMRCNGGRAGQRRVGGARANAGLRSAHILRWET